MRDRQDNLENCKSWARLEFILHVIQISGKAFQKNFIRIQPGLLRKGLSGPKYRHHYYQSSTTTQQKASVHYLPLSSLLKPHPPK